jgi:hypothetical protein
MINDLPEIFYIDVQVSNISSNEQFITTLAEYNQNRVLPYLLQPEKYFGSIVQFNLTNTNAPIITAVMAKIVPAMSDGLYILF